jgi:TRAP-type C4-dicarboxylate transport system substrate-binding protein
MKRLGPIALFALALLLSTLPLESRTNAQTPAIKTISIATVAPPGSTLMRGFEAWNREIRRRTNQSLQFRFYAGGVQGDEPELLRKIRGGRIDGCTVTSLGLSQIYRPALVLQLPGTFLRYEQLDAARAALSPTIDAGMVQAGFHMLGWADVGQAHIFSSGPVRVPGDLAGKRMWRRADDLIMPAFFDVVRTTPVTLALAEVLGGLQTGRIDTFLAPPVVAAMLQWSGRARTMTDIPMAIVIGGTVIGDRAWQTLTEQERLVLTETGAQFHALGRRNSRAAEQQAIAALVSRGIEVVTTTDAQRNEWRAVGRQVRARVASRIADAALIERAAAFGER